MSLDVGLSPSVKFREFKTFQHGRPSTLHMKRSSRRTLISTGLMGVASGCFMAREIPLHRRSTHARRASTTDAPLKVSGEMEFTLLTTVLTLLELMRTTI